MPKKSKKRKSPDSSKCGLCGKSGKLIKTECCGQWICDDEDKYVFWYAVRKYPAMSRQLQQATETKSRTEYIQKYRPQWGEEAEPSPEYVEFYKKLPEAFEEGSPKRIERARPGAIGPSVTVIEPTKVEYGEATGNVDEDVPVVIEIIRQVRSGIQQAVLSYKHAYQPIQKRTRELRQLHKLPG